MYEIRFHGRGGQGTVLAVKMLADAVLRSGRGECMAIPEFGVERRGAPVLAYARISDGPIAVRTRIYEPDAVVVMDPTLAGLPSVAQGLKPAGTILVNTEKTIQALAGRWPGLKVRTVPASAIALSHRLGSAASPFVNTAMLGAAAAVLGIVDMASLEAAIREGVPKKPDENAAAAREAYSLCLEASRA